MKRALPDGRRRLVMTARGILEHLGLGAEPLPTLRAPAPPVTIELFPAA